MKYGWVKLENGREVYRRIDARAPSPRSDLPCPMVISDDMPACEHVDGKFYSSKSAFRRVTKANGLIEVGNDPARFKVKPKPDRRTREKAIDDSIDRAIARAQA